MAITIEAEPYDFTPAYNQCKFIVDSTNVNKPGFKYIFEVFESGTATKIATYKALPSYGTGYGEVDLSKLLSNQVSFDFQPDALTFYDASNCYYKYDVKIGEEYILEEDYTAALQDDGNGNVLITTVAAAHPFVIGDQINIIQDDGGVANPGVEGLHTVLDVPNANELVINALFADVTDVNENGTIRYANNEKDVNLNIVNTLNKFVFNGAEPWRLFPGYTPVAFELSPANLGRMLTTQPFEFTCTKGQFLFLNHELTGFVTSMLFTNSNGSQFIRVVNNSTNKIAGVPCGPGNLGTLTYISGPDASLIPNDTITSYTIQIFTGVPAVASSAIYTIKLDYRKQIDEHQIMFVDRLGSISSFAFQLRSYTRVGIKRETYNKDVQGYIDAGQWTYDSYEQGLVNINTQLTKTLDLNTNFMTESMSDYFLEMLSSPATWILPVSYGQVEIDGECVTVATNYDDLQSCNVLATDFEMVKQRNQNLIRHSIQVRFSNNDVVNG